MVQQTEYYGFGLAVIRQGDVNTNKYLYNGKEQQLQTPWLDYGARMYDPTIGRWSVVDPLADVEPGLTPYRYGFNNPVLVTDPDGMFEYSDGYSKQDSRYSTGSMEFSGTYQDAGDGPGKRDNPASSKKKDKVSGPLLSESGQPINPDGSAYFDPGDRTNAWLFAADKRDEEDPTRIIDNLITLFSPTKVFGGLGLLSKANPGSKVITAKQLAAKTSTKRLTQFTSSTIDESVSLTMRQKELHIFANKLHPKPWLNQLSSQMGGNQNVIKSALQNANGRISPNAQGVFNTPVNVGGLSFTIRGYINQGTPIINSIFIP